MAGVVESRSVKKSSLHTLAPLWMRLNVTPFVLLYCVCLWGYLFKYEEWGDYPMFAVPAVVLLHLLSILACYWSVHIRTFFTCRSTKNVREGVFVKICPIANKGASAFVPVQYRSLDQRYFISWRKRTFVWNATDHIFSKKQYPTQLSFSEYKEYRGITSDAQREEVLRHYDNNKYVI